MLIVKNEVLIVGFLFKTILKKMLAKRIHHNAKSKSSYFHGRPHPIQKSVYLMVYFFLVLLGCGLP